MCSAVLFLIVFVAGYVRSDVYYGHPSNPDTRLFRPLGYYRAPTVPVQDPGYEYYPVGRAYGVEDARRGNYYTGGNSDGHYYNGDVLRKRVEEAEGARRRAGGSQAVSVDSKGSEDYAGHSSVREQQAGGEAAKGKLHEFGTTAKEAYDGKTRFKKGHSKSGFEKSYRKEESGKDSKFVDEELKEGGGNLVKSYGDKLGHWTEEGYGEARKDYDRTATGSGVAKSGLDSSARHDVFNGQDGHRRDYVRGDSLRTHDKAASYHDGHQTAGKTTATMDQMNGLYQQPFYYP